MESGQVQCGMYKANYRLFHVHWLPPAAGTVNPNATVSNSKLMPLKSHSQEMPKTGRPQINTLCGSVIFSK
jgi:hypothetical protein